MATATKQKLGKLHTYASTAPDFQIVRVRAQEGRAFNGEVFQTNQADYENGLVKFENGFLRVREGEQVLPNPKTGEPEDLVTFLERQRSFGNFFHRVDDPAPPVSQEEMATLMAAAGDKAALEQIFEAESEGHARPQILEAVRTQLGLLG